MTYPSHIPMEMPSPGYIIYRDAPEGQPYDPTSPPVFFPPKNSDELFDALRAKFPLVKSHSERMRDAIIEFLIEERQAELTQSTPSMPTTDSCTTSPWQQSWPSMSSGSGSTWSSPELLNLATPGYIDSPQPPVPDLSRQVSTAGSTTGTLSEAATSPLGLERMTGVFSLSTSSQPKQRSRRKMTEAEKVEYRKRRIVKACDKCAQRKRKCHHNEPEMDRLAAKTNKVTKAQVQKPGKSSTGASIGTQAVDQIMDMSSFDSGNSFASDMQLFDDFTNFFDESLLDPGLDVERHTNYWQLPAASTNVQIPITDCVPDNSQDEFVPSYHQNATLVASAQPHDFTARQPMLDVNRASRDATRLDFAREGTVDEDVNAMFKNRPHTHGASSSWTNNARGHDETHIEPFGTFANSQSRSTIATVSTGAYESEGYTKRQSAAEGTARARQDATHTLHAHDSLLVDPQGTQSRGPFATRDGMQQQPSLAHVVSTLLHVKKALTIFSNLPASRSPIPRNVMIQRVAALFLLRDPAWYDNMHASSDLSEQASGAFACLHQDLRHRSAVVGTSLHQQENQAPMPDVDRQPVRRTAIARLRPDTHYRSPLTGDSLHQRDGETTGPLEGMSIGDYLRMKTNFDEVNHGGSSTASAPILAIQPRRTSKEFGYNRPTTPGAGGTSSEGLLASTSVPSSRAIFASCQGAEIATARIEGRPTERALGDRITRGASPSTELYMVRKRLPSLLRNGSHSSARLQTIAQPVRPQAFEWHESETSGEQFQTNGGAYLRSDDADNDIRQELAVEQDARDKRVAISSNPRANGFSWDLHRQPAVVANEMYKVGFSPTKSSNSYDYTQEVIFDSFGFSPNASASASISSNPATHDDTQIPRLRDTHRERDHFGRNSQRDQELATVLALAGSLLLLHSVMANTSASSSAVNTTLLLLAIFQPAPGTKGRNMRGRAWRFWSTLTTAMLDTLSKLMCGWAISEEARVEAWETKYRLKLPGTVKVQRHGVGFSGKPQELGQGAWERWMRSSSRVALV